ncbi:cysteate racemase [Veronia nyctiphanis]|uniref:aspartate/glutamate racemase family protein n=1 Tax=Veronia nyctiphanis TaxID=1278244 RepID=UPI001F23D40D|nr:amino acid racemase [Veronia nyctiphanis]
MRKKPLTVGIMGGMGPDATVDLMQRIIKLTPASDDIDHIRLLVDNNPKVPSRIKALIDQTGESPLPALIAMAQGLQQAGADFLVIACNTAHHYYSDIRDKVAIPMLNTIEISAAYLSKQKPFSKRIGLLASTAVQQVRLFEPYFSEQNIEIVFPDSMNQHQVMALIKRIKRTQFTSMTPKFSKVPLQPQ